MYEKYLSSDWEEVIMFSNDSEYFALNLVMSISKKCIVQGKIRFKVSHKCIFLDKKDKHRHLHHINLCKTYKLIQGKINEMFLVLMTRITIVKY